MKKTASIFLGLSLLATMACTKTDNLAGPDSGFQGNLVDATAGGKSNVLTETGGMQIKLEELSWSATPTPQYIPSKPDGTFEDSQLFKGHYRVTPYGGAFWPVDPIELDINGMTSHDFTVTPYAHITGLTWQLDTTTLTMNFKIDPPVKEGLPQIIDVRSYINVDKYVGAGATISQYTDGSLDGSEQIRCFESINADWNETMAAKTFTLKIRNLKRGRTYYARVGVRFNDSFKSSNLAEIFQVDVK